MSATKEWFMSREEQPDFWLVGDYPNAAIKIRSPMNSQKTTL